MSTTNQMNEKMTALLSKMNRSQIATEPVAEPADSIPADTEPVIEAAKPAESAPTQKEKVSVKTKQKYPKAVIADMNLDKYCEVFLSNRKTIQKEPGATRVQLDLQNSMDVNFICDCTRPHTSVTAFVNQIIRLHIQEFKPLLRQLNRPRLSWDDRKSQTA